MKIIDAHIHFYDQPYFDEIAQKAGHENSEEHLRKVYGECNIQRAVVMGNRNLDQDSHRYPEFMRYCVGLDGASLREKSRDEVARQVEEHLRREDCVGIKLYPGYDPHYVSDPLYGPFYELAQTYNKPVAIHTGATATNHALLKYSHPLTLDDVAVAWPKVRFVMCHFGSPWVVDAAAVLNKNENVAADLSGILEGKLDMDRFFADNDGFLCQLKTWLTYAGDYSRLLYGTDWPLANIDNYITFTQRLIPEVHWDKVFFHNANRIYGLGL